MAQSVLPSAKLHAMREAIFAFVSFYFLLFGLLVIVGSVNDPEILLGDLFASSGTGLLSAMRRNTLSP
jgi:hypothetical protein